MLNLLYIFIPDNPSIVNDILKGIKPVDGANLAGIAYFVESFFTKEAHNVKSACCLNVIKLFNASL